MSIQDFLKNSSYKEIKSKIEESRNSYKSLGYFIDETFRIIKRNPFNENIIEFLLKEGWVCSIDSDINNCRTDIKKINFDRELISEGKKYDFYERDIVLMHELNHAWYSRFQVISEWNKCLSDKIGTMHEYENRLINEILSRENRANPWILKKAVEGFGLEPQIYDLVSKMAFESNSQAKISRIAKKNKDLVNTTLMDGYKNHYTFPKQF